MSRLMEEVTDWVYGGFRPDPLSISNSRFCWAYQPKQQQLTTADEFPGRGLPRRAGPFPCHLELQMEKRLPSSEASGHSRTT